MGLLLLNWGLANAIALGNTEGVVNTSGRLSAAAALTTLILCVVSWRAELVVMREQGVSRR